MGVCSWQQNSEARQFSRLNSYLSNVSLQLPSYTYVFCTCISNFLSIMSETQRFSTILKEKMFFKYM